MVMKKLLLLLLFSSFGLSAMADGRMREYVQGTNITEVRENVAFLVDCARDGRIDLIRQINQNCIADNGQKLNVDRRNENDETMLSVASFQDNVELYRMLVEELDANQLISTNVNNDFAQEYVDIYWEYIPAFMWSVVVSANDDANADYRILKYVAEKYPHLVRGASSDGYHHNGALPFVMRELMPRATDIILKAFLFEDPNALKTVDFFEKYYTGARIRARYATPEEMKNYCHILLKYNLFKSKYTENIGEDRIRTRSGFRDLVTQRDQFSEAIGWECAIQVIQELGRYDREMTQRDLEYVPLCSIPEINFYLEGCGEDMLEGVRNIYLGNPLDLSEERDLNEDGSEMFERLNHRMNQPSIIPAIIDDGDQVLSKIHENDRRDFEANKKQLADLDDGEGTVLSHRCHTLRGTLIQRCLRDPELKSQLSSLIGME